MASVETRKVEADEAGMRLDRWFHAHYPELGFGHLQKLIRSGQVRVDGGRVKTNTRLEPGQAVRIPPLGPGEAKTASASAKDEAGGEAPRPGKGSASGGRTPAAAPRTGGRHPDAEFLRWTLSDGAACLLIEDRPATHRLSLRVDWISLRSFADRFGACMTGGAMRGQDGLLTPWSHARGIAEAARAGAFQLRQDIAALYCMLPVWLGEFMRLVDERRIDPQAVDWFLCHFSAHSLREEMARLATKAGCMIPEERWFTNIYEKGNVGAASIFLLIDDLLRSGRTEAGQKVLLAVPESGQCIISYAGLTVVRDER